MLIVLGEIERRGIRDGGYMGVPQPANDPCSEAPPRLRAMNTVLGEIEPRVLGPVQAAPRGTKLGLACNPPRAFASLRGGTSSTTCHAIGSIPRSGINKQVRTRRERDTILTAFIAFQLIPCQSFLL